jgi:hypothetical protein
MRCSASMTLVLHGQAITEYDRSIYLLGDLGPVAGRCSKSCSPSGSTWLGSCHLGSIRLAFPLPACLVVQFPPAELTNPSAGCPLLIALFLDFCEAQANPSPPNRDQGLLTYTVWPPVGCMYKTIRAACGSHLRNSVVKDARASLETVSFRYS